MSLSYQVLELYNTLTVNMHLCVFSDHRKAIQSRWNERNRAEKWSTMNKDCETQWKSIITPLKTVQTTAKSKGKVNNIIRPKIGVPCWQKLNRLSTRQNNLQVCQCLQEKKYFTCQIVACNSGWRQHICIKCTSLWRVYTLHISCRVYGSIESKPTSSACLPWLGVSENLYGGYSLHPTININVKQTQERKR
jgi:hypothetical protein